MNRKAQGSIQIGIVAVAVGLSVWKFLGVGQQPVEVRAVESSTITRSPSAVPPTASKAVEIPKVRPKPRALAKDVVFEFDKELDQYSQVKTKVFANETDQAIKQSLFSNHRFIDGLSDYLRRSASSDLSSVARQGAAIDFLFEALASETGRHSAEAALRDVVLDAQIEDGSLDMKSREGFAGIKADVLYKWAATEPQRTSEFEAWLPGPVSRKVWSNVLATQERNVQESLVIGQNESL